MKNNSTIFPILLVAVGSPAAHASVVQVTLTVDDPVLLLAPEIPSSTILHVWAQVLDGTSDNGVYAFALNMLESDGSVIRMDTATLLGDPMLSISNSGSPMFDGLHDIYGGDGGYFLDRNRGVGNPFELFAIPIQALQPGDVKIFPTVADHADFLGIPDGFLLQQPGSFEVDFGPGVSVRVVPEPSSFFLLCVASTVLIRWSRNSGARGHESLKDGCCAELRPIAIRALRAGRGIPGQVRAKLRSCTRGS